MPEYLSPAVYVEEIDSGSKPIEGVSTSTAAMLGVTERGPSNVPILVTSFGEYVRWFGERLDPVGFADHCFLPHAVEGFFTNAGKRLYLTRIEAQGAARARFDLHDRGSDTSADTRLLRPAAEGTGLGTNPTYVLNVNQVFPGSGTLVTGDRIRIGNGSEAEYRIISNIGTAFHVPISVPLARPHVASLTTVEDRDLTDTATALNPTLAAHSARGAAVLTVAGTGWATGDLLEVDSGGGLAELRFVRTIQVVAGNSVLTLDSPLALEHSLGASIHRRDPSAALHESAALVSPSAASGGVGFVTPPVTNFSNPTHLAFFQDGSDPTRSEVRRIGQLAALFLDGAFDDYPAGSIVAHVSVTSGASSLLTAAVPAGATALPVNDRTPFTIGSVVQIGVAPDAEYGTVVAIPNKSLIAPDAGNLILMHRTRSAHATSAPVQAFTAKLQADRPAAGIVLDARRGNTAIAVGDGGQGGSQYVANDIVCITTADGASYYHTLTAPSVSCDAKPVTLAVAVERAHPVGSAVDERALLLAVQALDTGAWGDRLRITVEDEAPGLVTRTNILSTFTASRLRFSSLTGVEAGTVLEVVDAATGATLDPPVKVQSVDRTTSEVTLDPLALLQPAQFAVLLGAPPGAFQVRSREFRITVRLLRQPDPTLPSRNQAIVDREVFRFLSMDPRHSRYVQKIIGDLAGPPRLSDHRPDGESWYVRVSDVSPSNDVRLGPEALLDVLPDGQTQAAQHPLSQGDDSIVTLDDATYIGTDDVNPEKRTGLFSLANVDDVSILACPGRVSLTIQNALIDHCEQLRYRFAVLDGQSPPHDSIEDIITQRQQYDTKYAALYHPWLLVPQPFPASAAAPPEFAIPPSGHVLGIFARTDVERGVHKAPANEVVRGIVGLQRALNKEQHDLLNPYPLNINVIRDFRNEARGIRVYGGRCITSDSDWKYVNVRRLLIFIEKSVDLGLQWVVFEPNAEPLWARVRRSITNFLTLVWRNGALEGTKPEEAFFVKCDRTTMTQTDIDSGRLICIVGVAPVKPAEFVIVRIGLWTANAGD